MSDAVIMLLGLTPAAPIRWGRVTAGRLAVHGILPLGVESGDVPLDDLRTAIDEATIAWALLPGEQACARHLATPPKSAAKFLAAAAYLLEDDLAEPIENVQVAIASGSAGGIALAVRKQIVANWASAFHEVGLFVDAMAADYLALPSTETEAVVIVDQDRVIASFATAGLAVDGETGVHVFADILDAWSPDKVVLYGDLDQPAESFGESTIDHQGPASDEAIFLLCSAGIDSQPPPNLLSGPYRRKREWRGQLHGAKRAGFLTGGVAFSLCCMVVAQGLHASRLINHYDKQTTALHAQAFPDGANENPVGHARRILRAGGSADSLSLLWAKLGTSIALHDSIQVDRLRYDVDQEQLAVSVRVNSLAALEEFKKTLGAAGLVATEAGGLRQNAGVFVGELLVVSQ